MSKNMMGLAVLAVTMGLAAAATTAVAQSFPTKAMTMVIPFAAGSGNDVVGRVVTRKMTQNIGQPVIADNREGASGNIAALYTKNAAPDGHTFFISSNSFSLNMHAMKVDFRLEDYAGVSLIGTFPYVLSVPPSLPAKSVAEFVALAKAKPNSINAGTGGASSTGYFLVEALKKQTGIDVVMVPYQGSSQAQVDLVAGRIQLNRSNLISALPLARAGKLRFIGITGDKRHPLVPDVPTVKEQGFPILDSEGFYSILVPAATPRAIIQRLNAELVKVLRDKETLDQFAKLGVDPAPTTPEATDVFMKKESAIWSQAVRDAGVSLQ